MHEQEQSSGNPGELEALRTELELHKGVWHAQETMIQATLEPLGVAGPPWDNHAVEDAADMIQSLRTERDALNQQVQNLTYSNNHYRETAETWRSAAVERDALKARVEALEDALRDCDGALSYIKSSHGELYGVGWDRAQGKAEKVLCSTPAADLAAYDERVKRETCGKIVASLRTITNDPEYLAQVLVLAGIEPKEEKK